MRSQVLEICHGHARIDSRGRYRLSVVVGDVYKYIERKKERKQDKFHQQVGCVYIDRNHIEREK